MENVYLMREERESVIKNSFFFYMRATVDLAPLLHDIFCD